MTNRSRKTQANVVAIIVQMVALVIMLVADTLMAAPARRQPLTVRQPDGQQITIVQQGDEWHHWFTDLEGRLMVKGEDGYYRTATEEQQEEWEQKQLESISFKGSLMNHKKERQLQKRTANHAATRSSADNNKLINNHLSSFPTQGEVHGLVILVEFPDCQFSDSTGTRQYYQDFMMKKGFDDLGSYGSVRDYFIENSMGVFTPSFDVYGPVRVSQPEAYYGANNANGNDINPQDMIIEACKCLDDSIDFSKYDCDKDGYIDIVHIIYAGEGENSHSKEERPDFQPELIWPHSSSVILSSQKVVSLDGAYLDDYICTCELVFGQKDGIGTFCHEFCHALGLVDTYNTKGSNLVNGEFDMMDSGLYLGGNKEGRCPCALNAYERYELGWLSPDSLIANKYKEIITETRDTVFEDFWKPVINITRDSIYTFVYDTLRCMTTYNTALILPIKSDSNDMRDGEYYIFENRQQTGWDSYLPGHGMLAWHIDYVRKDWFTNMANTSVSHPCINLVKADNRPSVATYSSDPFPGTRSIKRFTAKTTPALLGWDNKGSGSGMSQSLNNAAITEIQEIPDNNSFSEESVIVFAFTNDSQDFILGIEDFHQDNKDNESCQIKNRANRFWRNGQLLIKTPNGIYDLQGRLIE